MAGTNNVLTLPKDAGRAIVEAAALICCPLLGTDRFVKFCRDRGASLDRERLLRLECLGLFAPVFRARRPADDAPPFYIPVRPGSSWFEQGWAWDTTAVPSSHLVPDFKDRSHEGYYSIFQLDYLCRVLNQLTFSVQMDGFIDLGDKIDIDWNKQGRGWLHHAEGLVEIFRSHGAP